MRRSVVALVLAVVTGACGVPSQDAPRVIRDAALPPEPTTSRPAAPAVALTRVYLVHDDVPVPVLRRAAGPGLADVLDALVAGPTEAEVASGVRTALPAGVDVRVVRIEGRVATLDVSSLLNGVTGQEQILVFAQLVLTAGEVPDVAGVVFERDGRRIDAPTVDGTLVTRPVTAADYAPLLNGQA